MKAFLFGMMLLAGFSSAHAAAATYKIDPNHTQVLFSYVHFGFSNITLRFNQVAGEIAYDAAAPGNSSVNVSIPTSSINTGVAKFDTDIQSANFFDVAKYPTATFKSTKVVSAANGKLRVIGDLTIHGVTKAVEMAVTVNKVGIHGYANVPAVGFDGTISINRSDFAMAGYVPAVSDAVTIKITVEALAPKS